MSVKDDMALLERLGQACYGSEWIRPLARDLAINHRTVSRWATGQALIEGRHWEMLLRHARERVAGIECAAADIGYAHGHASP
jgi:hypothetical protein